ncbi:Rrf2 family transcriptional regulator [Hymenobacter aerilatus]|uniref:Rrf2 family transcriptional regulator n=1 Tax=Hymenobacter aerilatus TaxID=2932251 RepID=A0A8T9STL2_9BACT|nr:Rrf2 family transcriptional regulator [Hymenobacter aerilatus]UOR04681.1 Rrf2 family transcriptional regulator [Hymenobacter aerilatus]
MNTRFVVATHILAYLARANGQPVSSEVVAKSVGTHPVVVRRLLGDLRRAGLVRTQLGTGGGALLNQPLERITLLDVLHAMLEPEADLFAVNNTNPNAGCDVGRVISDSLDDLLGPAKKAMQAALAAVPLTEVIRQIRLRLADEGCGCSAEPDN